MSRNATALSISFELEGKVPNCSDTLDKDVRGGGLQIDGKTVIFGAHPTGSDKTTLSIINVTEVTQTAILAANSFFTTETHKLIAKITTALAKDDPTLGIAVLTDSQLLSFNSETRTFTYTAQIKTSLDKFNTIPKGLIKVEGKVNKDGSVQIQMRISLVAEKKADKEMAQKILKIICDDILSQNTLSIGKQFNAIKRKLFLIILPIATILTAGAVAPALIFFLLPLLSSMGLPFLALVGIGAGISLITLAVLFQTIGGIFLVHTNPQASFPRIIEDTIDGATLNAATPREGMATSVKTPGVASAVIASSSAGAAAHTGVIDTTTIETDHPSGGAAQPVKTPVEGLILRGLH